MTTAKKDTAKGAAKKAAAPRSMPAKGKDPKGGLTAEGRKFFRDKEGSKLKPGVTGAADTPEKMMRKGSFLRRHFANPRGPMVDEKGAPTRLALSAHAWGEPVPKDEADAKKLAAKGHTLLEQYHAVKEKAEASGASSRKKTAKVATTRSTGAKKATKARVSSKRES